MALYFAFLCAAVIVCSEAVSHPYGLLGTYGGLAEVGNNFINEEDGKHEHDSYHSLTASDNLGINEGLPALGAYGGLGHLGAYAGLGHLGGYGGLGHLGAYGGLGYLGGYGGLGPYGDWGYHGGYGRLGHQLPLAEYALPYNHLGYY